MNAVYWIFYIEEKQKRKGLNWLSNPHACTDLFVAHHATDRVEAVLYISDSIQIIHNARISASYFCVSRGDCLEI